MAIESLDAAFKQLRIEELEGTLLRMQQNFRNVLAHARCHICGEPIDDQRWHLGEYVSGNQELVHTECYDEEAERAASQESYWCGGTSEEGEKALDQLFIETTIRKATDGDGSRGGQPEGAPEANPCAAVVPDRPATETHEQVHWPRRYAVEDPACGD